ncbi:MAG: metallopeptidase TldD-related protein [Chloroflexota bacterium]
MIEAITEALRANPQVHDWQIRQVRTVQRELYLIGETVESRRRADSATATVNLFHDLADGRRGMATLTFTPADMEDVAARIERGVFTASLAGNPPYALPAPAPVNEVVVRDAAIAERPDETIERWRQTLLATLAGEQGVRLSASEFFVYADEVTFRNSRGVAAAFAATRGLIEFVLLSSNSAGESENYHSLRFRAAQDVDLAAIVRQRAGFARDMLRVSLPRQYRGPVVISGEPLAGLLLPFLARVDGERLYRRMFQTKVGDDMFSGREVVGDKLDLTSDGTLPYGVASAPVDGEGLPARCVPVLRAGRVENLLASKRYADYLQIPATGSAANTVVATGSVAASDLLQGPVYHLVSFADLYANPLTGEFVSEIRLGYEIGADGTARPVKGGSVSGSVFDAFANCRMSREAIKAGRYYGPAAIRFENLVIAGE